MTLKTHRIVSLCLAAIFFLAACAPAPVASPAATAAQDEVATAVAGTISAILTGTASAMPSPTATFTAAPVTETPGLPTATPFIIPTATSFSSGGGGGSVKPKYACDIIRQRPYDNQTFHPGDSFDVKWTLLNTGTATWPVGTDFQYLSGPQMTNLTFMELPEIGPRDQYAIVMDAQAPMEKGHHVMTWKVQGGFCFAYIAIYVE